MDTTPMISNILATFIALLSLLYLIIVAGLIQSARNRMNREKERRAGWVNKAEGTKVQPDYVAPESAVIKGAAVS